MRSETILTRSLGVLAAGMLMAWSPGTSSLAQAQEKRPNIVMLMTDDTGWNDLGAYSGGGAALGHPTPNLDRLASEGAMFTSLVRASKLHGRPCLIHNGTHSDPLGAVDRGCSR